jgi:hypothetical protein
MCLVHAHPGKLLVTTESRCGSVPTPAIAEFDREPPVDFARVAELNLLSQGLIAKAGTGRAPAHAFRIEARMYRELLRRIMLQDRDLPANDRLSRDLLLDMVRMSALLHSAADCKTGLVITCPPDLMMQLKSQQARIDQALGTTGRTQD